MVGQLVKDVGILSEIKGISTYDACSQFLSRQHDPSSLAVKYNLDNATQLLECISDQLDLSRKLKAQDQKRWLLILTACMVFFMQIGFAMLCAGCVRRKNVRNTMLKNLLDACGAAVAFWSIGYAFAFGDSGTDVTFIGSTYFFQVTQSESFDIVHWFYEYTFSASAVTIIAGTLAERCQMMSYLVYSFVLTGFVYPVIVHAIWSQNGFLSASAENPLNNVGAIDFSGGAVVHLTGGTVALVAVYILGPRKGRFHDSKGNLLAVPRSFPGHSMALQLMGTLILWFGWFGFNAGSALLLPYPQRVGSIAALAASNTALAGAMGALSAMFTNLYLEEKQTGEYQFDLTMTMNGALSGLVSITAGVGVVETWAALLIGMIAGWFYMGFSKLLVRLKIDDAVDAIPVHMGSGAWGAVAVGLFASPRRLMAAYGTSPHTGWFYSLGRGSLDATLLGNQILAILFVVSWSVATMMPFFVFLNYMGWFRTNSIEELVGLDMAYHGSKQVDPAECEAEDGGMTEESISAYKARKGLRQRKQTTMHGSNESSSVDHQELHDILEHDLEHHEEDAPPH